MLLGTKKQILLVLSLFYVQLQAEPEFVVVIPSYNNEKWCIANLDSVMHQKYSNFDVIYVNDCSTDKTKLLVDEYVNACPLKNKIRVVHNTKRLGSLNNIYNAVRSCSDNKIIILVDGDDKLYSDQILTKLAQVYKDKNIWLTYGQYINSDNGHIGFCSEYPKYIIKKNAFRKDKWRVSHLKTFYAGLFKHIKKQDLLFKDEFFSMAGDVAFMLPMIELASKGHTKCIKDIFYIYNRDNIINDHRVNKRLQFYLTRIIRSRGRYRPLVSL